MKTSFLSIETLQTLLGEQPQWKSCDGKVHWANNVIVLVWIRIVPLGEKKLWREMLQRQRHGAFSFSSFVFTECRIFCKQSFFRVWSDWVMLMSIAVENSVRMLSKYQATLFKIERHTKHNKVKAKQHSGQEQQKQRYYCVEDLRYISVIIQIYILKKKITETPP